MKSVALQGEKVNRKQCKSDYILFIIFINTLLYTCQKYIQRSKRQ